MSSCSVNSKTEKYYLKGLIIKIFWQWCFAVTVLLIKRSVICHHSSKDVKSVSVQIRSVSWLNWLSTLTTSIALSRSLNRQSQKLRLSERLLTRRLILSRWDCYTCTNRNIFWKDKSKSFSIKIFLMLKSWNTWRLSSSFLTWRESFLLFSLWRRCLAWTASLLRLWTDLRVLLMKLSQQFLTVHEMFWWLSYAFIIRIFFSFHQILLTVIL